MNNENDITRKYTDEQIWEMLMSKMEKMGINCKGEFSILTASGYKELTEIRTMSIEDVVRLVATVYRSGYVRGRKGRSFIIGEKKEGHWEHCYEGEKLPEGTKVKLNENIDQEHSLWHLTKNSIGYSTKEKVKAYEEYPFYSGKLTDRLLKWVEE